MMSISKIVFLILPGVYVLVCVLLYFFQEKLLFHPEQLEPSYQFAQFSDAEEIFLPGQEAYQIHALHFRVSEPKGYILYFHGNSGALDKWGYAASAFTRLGYEVIMPDYPTYGKSTGKLSEKAIYQDAETIYQYLREELPRRNIILYGRSLGTGVATELATRYSNRLLILETPYTSITDMANKTIPIIPTGWLLRYEFDNLSKITSIKCPVHLFAASQDQLTPLSQAERLAAATDDPAANLTIITGAQHGDIETFESYHLKLEELLDNLD